MITGGRAVATAADGDGSALPRSTIWVLTMGLGERGEGVDRLITNPPAVTGIFYASFFAP
jgi:hypothetical protein